MDEQNESMTLEDSEIDAAWSEEEGPGAEAPEEEQQLDQADQPMEEQPAPEATADQEQPQEGEKTADQPETFTLKHLDETRTVGRDEVVSLAQKGMDYDRIRTERDQLRQYRQESDPAINLVKSYAEKNGMDLGQYIDFCRKQELMARGVNEQTASAQVELEKQQASIAAQTREAQEAQARQEAMVRQARERADARKRDMTAFVDAFPSVKGEEIPPEVWAKVAAGESLVTAYTMHKNQTLEAALAAERQNKQNQQRTTGSLTSPADGDRKDDIDRWWNEDD